MANETHDPHELLRRHRDQIRAQVREIGDKVTDLSRVKEMGCLTEKQDAGRRSLEALGHLLQRVEKSTAKDMAKNAERSVDRE